MKKLILFLLLIPCVSNASSIMSEEILVQYSGANILLTILVCILSSILAFYKHQKVDKRTANLFFVFVGIVAVVIVLTYDDIITISLLIDSSYSSYFFVGIAIGVIALGFLSSVGKYIGILFLISALVGALGWSWYVFFFTTGLGLVTFLITHFLIGVYDKKKQMQSDQI